MAEISVIVPVYNSQAFLKECVESVKTQSMDDWELILVDDGSTDGSGAICRLYADSDRRIKLISKHNGGLSSARNAGLDAATGKYVFFLDADDELYPHSLRHLYEAARQSEADITVGRSIYTAVKPIVNDSPPRISEVNPRQLCIDTLYQKAGTDNSACWRLFRRSLFDDTRFYNGWYEDLEIFHRLLIKAGKVVTTDSTVYFYRKHPQSFIRSWSDGRRDIVKVTAEIVRLFSDDPQLKRAALSRHFSACYNLLIAMLRDKADDQESIDACFNEIKKLRTSILTDRHSRLKNRAGALMSYFGVGLLKRLS